MRELSHREQVGTGTLRTNIATRFHRDLHCAFTFEME